MRFCSAITSYCIGKQLFCTINKRSWCRDLIDDTIPYKMLIIPCACAFRLLILRLQAGLSFLRRLLIDTICATTLANFCHGMQENINLFILQGHFDIAKSVNAACKHLNLTC